MGFKEDLANRIGIATRIVENAIKEVIATNPPVVDETLARIPSLNASSLTDLNFPLNVSTKLKYTSFVYNADNQNNTYLSTINDTTLKILKTGYYKARVSINLLKEGQGNQSKFKIFLNLNGVDVTSTIRNLYIREAFSSYTSYSFFFEGDVLADSEIQLVVRHTGEGSLKATGQGETVAYQVIIHKMNGKIEA